MVLKEMGCRQRLLLVVCLSCWGCWLAEASGASLTASCSEWGAAASEGAPSGSSGARGSLLQLSSEVMLEHTLAAGAPLGSAPTAGVGEQADSVASLFLRDVKLCIARCMMCRLGIAGEDRLIFLIILLMCAIMGASFYIFRLLRVRSWPSSSGTLGQNVRVPFATASEPPLGQTPSSALLSPSQWKDMLKEKEEQLTPRGTPRGTSQMSSASLPLSQATPTPLSVNRQLPVVSTPTRSTTTRFLCPNLVVPHGNECFLAMPMWKSIGVPPKPLDAFHVFDLEGNRVIQVEVAEVPWGFSGDNSRISDRTPPAVVLKVPSSGGMSLNDAGPTSLGMLAYSKAGREVEGRRSMFIYDGQNTFFAYITRDVANGNYILTSARAGLQLIFTGNYQEQMVGVMNEQREPVVITDLSTMPFDKSRTYVRLRASSGCDMGLMLCGLLSIAHMEQPSTTSS